MISKFKLADKKLLLIGLSYIFVVSVIFFFEILSNDYSIVNHYTVSVFVGFTVFFILLLLNQFLIRFSFYRDTVNFKNHRFIGFMIIFVYFLGFSGSLFLPYDKLFHFDKVEYAFQYFYPGEKLLKKYSNDTYRYIYYGNEEEVHFTSFVNKDDTFVEVDDYFEKIKLENGDLYYKYIEETDKSVVLFSSDVYVKNDYIVGDNRNSVFEYDCVKTDKRYYLYYSYINGKVDNTYELSINNLTLKIGE
jgi:hypothetical protein